MHQGQWLGYLLPPAPNSVLIAFICISAHTLWDSHPPSPNCFHTDCPGSRMEQEVGAEKCLIFSCLIVLISVLAASCQFIQIIRTGEVVKEFILISRLFPIRKGHVS